jgi:hypothetical protein
MLIGESSLSRIAHPGDKFKTKTGHSQIHKGPSGMERGQYPNNGLLNDRTPPMSAGQKRELCVSVMTENYP